MNKAPLWKLEKLGRSPRARYVLAGLAILAAAGISVLVASSKPPKEIHNIPQVSDPSLKPSESRDWEKLIYELRPGSGDFVQIPVSRGDDSLELLSKVQGDINLTQRLFNELIEAKGLENLLDPRQAEDVATELVRYISVLNRVPQFSESAIPDDSIIIIEDESNKAIKNYFNAVAEAYERNVSRLRTEDRDDFEIVLEALRRNNEAPLARLDGLIQVSRELARDVRKIPAPKILVNFHKREIWYLLHTTEQLVLLRNIRIDDPLYALTIITMRQEFKRTVTEFRAKEIPDFLKQRGIIFGSMEKARLLYPNI